MKKILPKQFRLFSLVYWIVLPAIALLLVVGYYISSLFPSVKSNTQGNVSNLVDISSSIASFSQSEFEKEYSQAPLQYSSTSISSPQSSSAYSAIPSQQQLLPSSIPVSSISTSTTSSTFGNSQSAFSSFSSDTFLYTPTCSLQDANTLYNLLLEYRMSHGQNSIIVDDTLSKAACRHSQWMEAGTGTSRFSHIGENASSFNERCAREGGQCDAENLYYGTPLSINSVVPAWDASPGHKANMLGKHTRVGIGVTGRFVTVVFF